MVCQDSNGQCPNCVLYLATGRHSDCLASMSLGLSDDALRVHRRTDHPEWPLELHKIRTLAIVLQCCWYVPCNRAASLHKALRLW